MAPKMAPKNGKKHKPGSLFRVFGATLFPEALQLDSGIDFWSLEASFFDIFHDFHAFHATCFNLFCCHCRQYLPASCFQLVRFNGQDLKVSAVALRLQSLLGAPFSAKKALKTECPEFR